jgi:hypothetical protein
MSLSVKCLLMSETTGVHPTCSVCTAGFSADVNEPQNNATSTAKVENVCGFCPLHPYMPS